MKISASITDFPVFSHIDTFFHEFKEAGVDGVEIVLGAKSRFFVKKLKRLVLKYNLPVTSVHQPPWSGIGLFFDEEFLAYAKELGTNRIVCHPLTFCSFESNMMKKYLQRLSKAQEKYGMQIMLENMPCDAVYKKLFSKSEDKKIKHLEETAQIAKEYNFLLTYDVSHAEFSKPQNEKIFQSIFPQIGNIHLSSFTLSQHHLPLNKGILDTKGFLSYLLQRKYTGLVTFEIYYPRLRMLLNTYDFSAVKDSVAIVRKITDKLS